MARRQGVVGPLGTVYAAIELSNGCARIAYSSKKPDHPVEHLLDGNSGLEATRWISARPDTI